MNETEREVRIEAEEDVSRIVDMSETETGAGVEIVNDMDMETNMVAVVIIGTIGTVTTTGIIGTTIETVDMTIERGTITETGVRAETDMTTEMIVGTGMEEVLLEGSGAESPNCLWCSHICVYVCRRRGRVNKGVCFLYIHACTHPQLVIFICWPA